MIVKQNNYCRKSIEWFPLNDTANEETSNNIGSFKAGKENFCLTAGLTTGIEGGVDKSKMSLDPGPHHEILYRARKGKFHCGIKSISCVRLLNEYEVDPIRARTVTSAGMKGIKGHLKDKKNHNDDAVQSYLRDFHLDVTMLQSTNAFYNNKTNIVNIARDNLR